MCARLSRLSPRRLWALLCFLALAIISAAAQETPQAANPSGMQPPSLLQLSLINESILTTLLQNLDSQNQQASMAQQSLQATVTASSAQSESLSDQSNEVQKTLDSSVQASSKTASSLDALSRTNTSLQTGFDNYRVLAERRVSPWRAAAIISAGAAAGALADGPRGALWGAAGGALGDGVYELGRRIFHWW